MNVLETINDFVGSIEERGVHKTFMDGYCYDFACMLKRSYPEGEIYFVEDEQHYVFFYKGEYFDVTGRRDDLPDHKRLVKETEERK